MAVSIIVSVMAGNSIRSASKQQLQVWARKRASSSARLVSDALDPMMPRDAVNIIGQVLKDRFAGYPNDPGYLNDTLVPFHDMDSGRRMYPVNAKNLRMDWDLPSTVNDTNANEHVGDGRWGWYRHYAGGLSTEGSVFHMQGSCDPNIFDPHHRNYHPNCTDAHNDPLRGGEVHNVPTTAGIYRKVKDLDPFFKALFEYSIHVKELGVFFANSGAGATAQFPHYEVDYTKTYISVGCDWMRKENPTKPGSGEPIGTEEEIARCHPNGTTVRNNLYNPLERGWCRDLALRPDKIQFIGPFLNVWQEHEWLMTIGRGEYDSFTGKFIGCSLVDLFVGDIPTVLEKVEMGGSSRITLVKWDKGTVVASPGWDAAIENETTTVTDPKLGLGVDKDKFQQLKAIADFEDGEVWDPANVRRAYEDATFAMDGGSGNGNNGKIVSTFPVPPPHEYSKNYKPDFMVIVTLEESEIFQSFYDLDSTVNREIKALVTFTFLVGFVGLIAVFGVIFAVSLSLTRPLKWMNTVADLIVNKFGEGFDLGDELNEDQHEKVLWCTPRTELSDLVSQFKKLVSRFSGDGTCARAVRFGNRYTEIRNRFVMLDEFAGLYEGRKNGVFKFDYGRVAADADPAKDAAVDTDAASNGNISFIEEDVSKQGGGGNTVASGPSIVVPRRRHFGPNIHHVDSDSKSASIHQTSSQNGSILQSPLFRWIVFLVVVPLVILSVVIASVVLWRISSHFTRLDEIVQEEYVELERGAMNTFAHLRAVQASEITGRAARDLHLYTRVAGWLLFGALSRTESFTKVESRASECRDASGPRVCDYVRNPPCDCKWNDQMNPTVCTNFTRENSRYLQTMWWEGQVSPWPNGDVNGTSPVAYSPSDKEWYENATIVPGHHTGVNASGHSTTYDRLRVMSASSPALMAIYNYDTSNDKPLGIYAGFGADGSFMGYSGCSVSHADRPFFKSTVENGAARMRPDLCPLGSFGYDARCRDWFHRGKAIGINTTSAPMYVSPPYVFAGQSITAQSCGMPLIDPVTQEFVGQTLVDFMPNAIISSLSKANTELVQGGFPVLVAARADVLGHDAVIGPEFDIGDPGRHIEELVVPNDPPGHSFYRIADDMREGKQHVESFRRTRHDGSVEDIIVAFAPVNVSSFRPMNASDYARGVREYNDVIYSLGLAQPKEELLRPFKEVGDTVQRQVNICIGVLAAVITVSTAVLIYVTSRVTVSITVPILHLLGLLRNVNRLETKDDFLPPADITGSREVFVVYDTFSILFKVVRFANSAFFTGDIEKAHNVLVDMLKLFKSLGNKKAIGVVSNNLGNCMLTMFRTVKETGQPEICGMNKVEIIAKGAAYFCDAIKLGEEAYDTFYSEQGWSGSCLVFMQHLSSRYFNRAIFLLTVKKDHRWPAEANRLGFRDLDIAKNMDVEVADQCLEVGFNIDETERFNLTMSRIRGLVSLKEMGYPDDEWEMDELVTEAFSKLKAAIQNPSSDFFREISPAGRMQQFDAELIRDAVLDERWKDAALIAIRMLIEDEYAVHEAESIAIEALVEFVDKAGDDHTEITPEVKNDLLRFQENFEVECLDTISRRIAHAQKAESASLDMFKTVQAKRSSLTKLSCTGVTSGAPASQNSSSLMRQSCRGDFTMEMF
uniref:Uncharacterized protein n=1 Tax=Odontella aurita TaxID=265563 RepID=A0A7S4NFJ6_9STRA